MMSISSQPATESQRCRRRATAGADELRCRTSHLAAVQKPPAHRIVVSEHARRSVPGTAILLVQTNSERGNASAERRRSGASGENAQHAVVEREVAASKKVSETRPKIANPLLGGAKRDLHT